ncbi:MarR family winged helix-turn-helix transcriptional regulator [Amycolatopsis echigonensis]|uniref:Winged helix-turn-helix transcriptional regulator n=1 Tax=Amycolatopsis echigonensis TaxID=2576905 RepID=A0A8E1W213_9PSEU|nr:MarR family winged helix-turn-helix transcriptional regulator [Amycolatopsis echigonensis]MBB2502348.1 winged helix-turn-helix transcriptional regulator [Amycolatopsis echigonensis]
MSSSPETDTAPSSEDVFARVAWALRRADLTLQTAKERPLREVGVPGSHYSVLISLHTNPGVTGAELARLLSVTPQAVALLIGKLTDRGLVERRTHPRHRAVQELHLTDAGRAELAKAEHIVSDLEQHIRESLGLKRYRQLRELLGQVIDELPNWEPPRTC